MDFIGKWKFDSLMTFTEEGKEYIGAEEYMNRPIEGDEREIAREKRERGFIVNSILDIAEDGNIYTLAPLPEGVSQEEIDAAIAAGQLNMRDDMMIIDTCAYEIRDGELYYDTKIKGEVLGQETDPWKKCKYEDGKLNMMFIRYVKL